MKKEFNRRSFILGSGVLTFSAIGVFFTGCGSSSSASKSNNTSVAMPSDNTPMPSMSSPLPEAKTKPVEIKASDKAITLSGEDFTLLKTRGYIDVPKDGMVVFYNESKFYGYSDICPHEQGKLTIEDANTIRCKKHTCQSYDRTGASRPCKTNDTLKLLALDVSSL